MLRTTFFFIVLGLSLAAAFAQEPPAPPADGAGQPRPGGQGMPPRLAYDRSQERTLEGTVQAVELRSMGPGRMVSLSFQAEGASWRVLVGPEQLLARQGMTLAAGDALSILGAATAGPEGPVFLARQISKGDATLTLLDGNGQPLRPGAR
jgi:hypothetical protein